MGLCFETLKAVTVMKPYMKGLLNQMSKISAKIQAFQERCKHTNIQRIPRGDTGNYDPSNDRYWNDCLCQDCNRRWSEPL